MLTRLSIRNIVLIEGAEIDFRRGLSVLSGETGAGKSILLDALGLALGARADSGLVRQGEEQGMVAAEFYIVANAPAREVLKELEIEEADTLIIRRSLNADGKTRCLVNDQPVTVAGLRRLGETLVEVHGQHDQRTLQDSGLHRVLLDEYGRLSARREEVTSVWRQWRECVKSLEALKAEIERTAREQEYLQHMRNELRQLDPQPGEEETLASRRTAMMQSEKLFDVLNEAIGELNQGKGVAASLRSALRILARSPLTVAETYKPILDGLDRAATEAEEALYALEKTGEQATFDPQKLETIEERLFALKAAGRKYNLPVEELPALHKEVEDKLALIDSQEHRLDDLEKQAAQAKAVFAAAAEKLSEARKKMAAKLEKAIAGELQPLKMSGTHFRVRIEKLPESGWSEWGMDGIAFECATNVSKGARDVAYAPLSKIASGGELSRFMLALKVALSSVRSTPTIIFDEIDTGTGGAVAAAIGERLSLLGKTMQVLVVTHLPQVAARGDQHLRISKQEKGKKVTTLVEDLSPASREEELARMLAGATVTAEARKAAQKLLETVA
ncbi:MAG: DNA repair protein RecN [Pseudomonadota bacterium]|nr:DNA repair protein RecN [Pseudomonadota bacterium]